MMVETVPVKRWRIGLYTFFVANLVSYVGDRLTLFAVPWFVLQTTGSAVQTGITAFFATLPSILSSFLSGLIVDRLGYKRTSVIGDIMSGVSVMLIPLLYFTTGLAFWQLLVLVFLGGLLKAPGETARASLLPDLAVAAKVRLEQANAIGDGMNRVSGLLAAPLAALLIVALGASNLLWLDGISFLLSALFIGISVPRLQRPHEDDGGSANLGDLLAGLRFIIQRRLLLSLMLTTTTTNLLDSAFFAVVMPIYAQKYWGSPIPLGVLSAVFGGFAFLSTLIYGAIGYRLPRRMTFAICFIVVGLRLWAMALLLPFPMLVVVHALGGLFVGPLNPILATTEQEAIPVAMRARVFGASAAGYLVGIPLGGLLAGYLLNWIGLLPGLFVLASAYLLVTGSLLVNPALQGMGEKRGKES